MATKNTKPGLKRSGKEMHAQQESPLSKLPAELREVIYADVLTNVPSLTDPTRADMIKNFPALLCTCRLIFAEARPLFRHRAYIFSEPANLRKFVTNLKPRIDGFTAQIPLRSGISENETLKAFEKWRAFLFPAAAQSSAAGLDDFLPNVRHLTIDSVDLSRLITARKMNMQAGDYDDVLAQMDDYEDWLCHAHAIHNGLVYILSAMSQSVNGRLRRPAWLQTDTIVSVLGLSAADSTTVVRFDLPADSGAILDFWHGRLGGAGQYLFNSEHAT
ncbi:hypothetical protein CBER1_09839 [Cercospora berteroae]|uniref:F-box domain-containing protein n=1 Tax=Cercospora berteroae TaxID=357750 RepID=A0A2S6BY31_9PEZI|nr:hypothetical protein CBER1_09839 [Cercospora berteroae]